MEALLSWSPGQGHLASSDDSRRGRAGWCGGSIAIKGRGRNPKWRSPSCRQRAWEQFRAAASGLSAAQLVERPFHVPVPNLDDLVVAIDVVVDAYRRRPWVRAFRRLTRTTDRLPRRARSP